MIDYKLLANTAMLAGEIMLCSGAETYRVEDTMYHHVQANLEEVHADVHRHQYHLPGDLAAGDLPASLILRHKSPECFGIRVSFCF